MSYSRDLREKALNFVKEGKSQAEASKVFGVGERTIRRWYKQLRIEGHINKKPYVKTKRKIDPDALRADVEKTPDAYLKERAQIFGVTPSGIWRELKRLKITFKKKPKNIKNGRRLSGKNI